MPTESRTSGEFEGSLSVVPNQTEDVYGGDPVNYNENGECIFGFGYHVTRGRRPTNEDRISVTPCMKGNSSLNFYGVYDGHQGAKASSVCSKEIPRLVLAALEAKGGSVSELDALDVFGGAFKEADALLTDMDDGSTACTVLVCKQTLFVASTGDSQAVLCRLGNPVPLNAVHKVTDARERQRIEAKGGEIQLVDGVERIDGILNMSRAMGNHKFRDRGVIADPSVHSRVLAKGDDFLILATDGLWNFVNPQRACQVMSTSTSASEAATTLVNLALHHGSSDNVAVIVVDLRPLFGGEGFARTPSATTAPAVFNIPQSVKSMAEKVLENMDLFQLPTEFSGWLLKESRSGFVGKRWQKRFFVLQTVEDAMVSKDASVHNSAGCLKVFVLHYHDSLEDSKKQNPKKMVFVDPSVAVVRVPALDTAGRVCFRMIEVATGDPFILGANSVDDAVDWITKMNASFRSNGFNPIDSTGQIINTLPRTLTEMDSNDPNKAINLDGDIVDMPTGNYINGEFTGPAQFKRTAEGNLVLVGGGWTLSANDLGEREMQSLVGLPLPGHMFSENQAKSCGVPNHSVLIK
mmetsp:Transcript_88586/g.143501  ORF Transcript_88586/g.143501 Transcript_88586/m.143501 type:complete len:578 (+) Transcript_88586:114-1847(+)|eukprot:CAMPEP_0179435250 /NCGR_PEP_ID=MMETSP0799-20121207/19402_1 /TAXON_ID=46947 /ORGANISM="Geminigera cryophila, Strain CCMP2564" /LENGTH=577 /DNA_ID=CAMNT_0021214517 /DNA_START=114 /DNA_END=1847 /DNA_ORIENTATION=-